jgi:hypothetical protein
MNESIRKVSIAIEVVGAKRCAVALVVSGEDGVLQAETQPVESLALALGLAGQFLFNLRTTGTARLEAGAVRRMQDSRP